MSILIKGMDMPETCGDCGCYDDVYQCGVTGNTVRYKGDPDGNVGWDERPNWCPLVEVKTPHGRLIDATGVDNATATKEDYPDGTILIPKGAITSASTIIEAEE